MLETIAPRGGIVRTDDARNLITLSGRRQDIAGLGVSQSSPNVGQVTVDATLLCAHDKACKTSGTGAAGSTVWCSRLTRVPGCSRFPNFRGSYIASDLPDVSIDFGKAAASRWRARLLCMGLFSIFW